MHLSQLHYLDGCANIAHRCSLQVGLQSNHIFDPPEQLSVDLVCARQNDPMIPIKLTRRYVMVLEWLRGKDIVPLLRYADFVVLCGPKEYRRGRRRESTMLRYGCYVISQSEEQVLY